MTVDSLTRQLVLHMHHCQCHSTADSNITTFYMYKVTSN